MGDIKRLEEFKAEGILFPQFADPSIVETAKEIVDRHFSESTDYYLQLDRDNFQDLAVRCQDELNENNLQRMFYKSEFKIFEELCPKQKMMFESVVFFRAVRPLGDGVKTENPDFHRETMYTDHKHTRHVINAWIPIKNVMESNALRYIPHSHLIPDEEMKFKVDELWPGRVEKYSSGHKLGFLWKPKKISQGVELDKAVTMPFTKNSYALFSSMLVHGGAQNNSKFIRFAIGFGMIPEKRMKQNKSFFASGGKNHYLEF